jgi:NTE family protein
LAVALSGGGYRAMLFHLGALRRLNEFGLLSVMDRMSTVSGGSITGAVLALRWGDFAFDHDGVAMGFENVERDVFDIASRTIDVKSALIGLLPGTTGAAGIARSLRRPFGRTSVADLPGYRPRFTFNTMNMQTGNLFRWSAPYAADYAVGKIERPTLRVAEVVAASAAFPPVLSPLRIPVPGVVVDHNTNRPVPNPPPDLVLTDGGVYDNLGIENVKSFHTVLASDGGAPFASGARLRDNLVSQSLRTMFLLNEDIGRQRRRALVTEFTDGHRLGALWTIKTSMSSYGAPDCLPCPDDKVAELAAVRTRLKRVPQDLKYRLANWGYASADAAVRTYVEPSLARPSGFAYPGGI